MLSFPLFALLGAPLHGGTDIQAPQAVLVKMPPTADLALLQRHTLRRHLRGVARLRGHIPHTHEFVLLPQPGHTVQDVMHRVRQLCPDAATRTLGLPVPPNESVPVVVGGGQRNRRNGPIAVCCGAIMYPYCHETVIGVSFLW